jgi:hypothetical protein
MIKNVHSSQYAMVTTCCRMEPGNPGFSVTVVHGSANEFL